MRRFVGPLLMATGLLHLASGFVAYPGPLFAIAGDGFLNAVEPGVAFSTFDREAAFWYMVFGVMLLMLGGLAAGRRPGRGPCRPSSAGRCRRSAWSA